MDACFNSFKDGDGNRLEKSSGKIYWYGAGTEILDESDLSGNFTNEYVFFGGRRIALRTISSGNIYYYEEDMLGSSRTMVQAGQTSVCFDADFLPFGYEKDVTTTCTQNYKFEGKERDTETSNDDFGARYYTFRLGRWLSADWSSVPAPVPYANLTNPQTLNLYSMVSDNPESFADLDGHCPGGVDCVNGNSGGGLSNSGSNTNPNNNPNNNTTVHVCTTDSSASGCPTGTSAGASGQSNQQTAVQQTQGTANDQTKKQNVDPSVLGVSSDTTKGFPTPTGVVQERDISYVIGTVDDTNHFHADSNAKDTVTMSEKQTGGNDHPVTCTTSSCSQQGRFDDSIRVSGTNKTFTTTQTFYINGKQATIYAIGANQKVVSGTTVQVQATSQNIKVNYVP